MPAVETIAWVPDQPDTLLPGSLVYLDQTRLPERVTLVRTTDLDTVCEAIRTLQIRGAPAIGVAAAMAVVAAVQAHPGPAGRDIAAAVRNAADRLAATRPTAVNLFRGLDRLRACAATYAESAPPIVKLRLAEAMRAFWAEDITMCRAIGEHGVGLLADGMSILTHCNAGSLATSAYGTALAPVYLAHERGLRVHVYVDETRPLLQGARLTAWELQQAGVPLTLICDNVAAHVMQAARVQAVLVGADRIAANGDTANKVGTYGLAVLARAHGIPFYVLAPSSTFDLALADGTAIPIEERSADEVTQGFGRRTAPDGIAVYAPAFDVTPARLITAIVCERGVLRPPFGPALQG